MKKKLIIVFSALALLLGCNKENVGISNNVIVLWWGGSTEEFGTLNSGSGIITSVGSVGDLQWWSSQCIVHGDTLHVLGENGSNTTQLKLYKCDLSKGNLLSQGNIAPGLTNLTIAGVYNNQVIVLGWNGSSEVFGTLNTTSGFLSRLLARLVTYNRGVRSASFKGTRYMFSVKMEATQHNKNYTNAIWTMEICWPR